MDPCDHFLEHACLAYRGNDAPARREAARATLAAHPRLPAEHFLVAVALADERAVRAHLDDREGAAARRELATAPGGPRGWEPLLYLCYSRVACEAADAMGVLRALLAHGADPGASFGLWGGGWTALTGGLGEGEQGLEACPPHPEAEALFDALLDAGADPNDPQGLYNTMFTEDDGWLRRLLARGLSAEHEINWDMGVEPRPRTLDFLLSSAVDRGLLERIDLLLEHGANPASTNPYNGRDLVLNARLAGHPEVVERLRGAGAGPPEPGLRHRFQLACLDGDGATARALVDAGAEVQDGELLRRAAGRGLIGSLRLLESLGAGLDEPDEAGVTPLHEAALGDRVEVVRFLLERGADRERRDGNYRATPLGWAEHNGSSAAAEVLRGG